MHSTNYTYEENNRVLEIEVQYSPVPYSPANHNEPEDGGYCEDFVFKVISATIYDDEGNFSKDTFTKEELQQLTKEFDDIFDKDKELQKKINDDCMEACERDYCDDRDDRYDDDDYGWLP